MCLFVINYHIKSTKDLNYFWNFEVLSSAYWNNIVFAQINLLNLDVVLNE